jgi:hypothetical protein
VLHLCRRPADASTPDWTRIASRRSSPLRGAFGVLNGFAVWSNQAH